MFFYLCKVLFSGVLQFKGNFVNGQNNDWQLIVYFNWRVGSMHQFWLGLKLQVCSDCSGRYPAIITFAISHAWLNLNVSCRHLQRLAWHNFQKYVNSDPWKERKPCIKWINDNTLLAISDFWSEKQWERAHIYTPPKTVTGKCEVCFHFHHSMQI